MKYNSQGMPISGMYFAYPMLHMRPVIAFIFPYWAKLRRK